MISVIFSPEAMFLDKTVRWLAHASFSDLRLRNIQVCFCTCLDGFFIQSLQTITLIDLGLSPACFADASYSDLFLCISELPHLKHCIFDTLFYGLPFAQSSSSEHEIHLISGRYWSDWDSLDLVFPDGKHRLEFEGGDIRKELEDLAAYTAAAERMKVRDVEAAGRLVDCRVMGVDTPILEEEDVDDSDSHRPPAIE